MTSPRKLLRFQKHPAFHLALKQITARASRNVALMILSGLFAFVLFLSIYLGMSMGQGLSKLGDRLGADIIVVPAGYDSQIQGAILRGEPIDAYFPEAELNVLDELEEVEAVSPQLFVQTLSASCCDYPLQLIGYDAKRDFSISAWVNSRLPRELKEGEVVVGANIIGQKGEELRFFSKAFHIAARMDKTGMGFDNSVFMTMETARKLMAEPVFRGAHPGLGKEEMVSVALLRIRPEYKSKDVAAKITSLYKGKSIYALTTGNFLRSTRDRFDMMRIFIGLILILTLLLVSLGAILIFRTILRERRAEIYALRLLGAKPVFLGRTLFLEGLLVCGLGALIGATLSLVTSLLLAQLLESLLQLPWLNPSAYMIALIYLLCLILGAFLAPLSMLFKVKSDAKQNPEELLRA